jgi:hypothetical protein
MPTRPKTGLLLFFSGGPSDTTRPTVAITSAAATITAAAFTCTFTFSEDVSGFELGDITVANGTAGTFATVSASVYTAVITPTATGTVTVDVAEGVCQDAAGNTNTAATQFSILYVAPQNWFDFSTVTGLYQTNDTSTPVAADGQTIGYDTDKSGQGHHATQGTANQRPLWKANIQNGLGAALFDGSLSNLIHTYDGTQVNHSIFVVMARAAAQTGYRGVYGSGGATGVHFYYRMSTNAQWGTYGAAERPANTTIGDATFRIFEMVRGASGNGNYYLNGTGDGTYADTIGQTTNYIGGKMLSGQCSNIYVGEILHFDFAVDATQRAAIESYLNSKWSLFF